MPQNKPVRIPLIKHLHSDDKKDMEDLNRYLAFIEVTDQIRIHKGLIPKDVIEDGILAWYEPYAAFFYLIWVFPTFSLDTHLQKVTQKDVYYTNSFSVYVFDQEAAKV